MRRISILLILSVVIGAFTFTSCQDEKVSYLIVKDLAYPLATLKVVKGLTEADMVTPPVPPFDPGGYPSEYATRIKNKSPWVMPAFYATTVEGGRPLTVEFDKVRTEGVGADAELFKKETKIISEGRLEIPFENNIPIGIYHITYKISNVSGSDVTGEVLTVTVVDRKDK